MPKASDEQKHNCNPKPRSESKSTSTRTIAIDLDPRTYSDNFDLTTELATNIDFYRVTDTNAGECITLRPVPCYLTESIERYQSSFSSLVTVLNLDTSTRRPGINPISSACIWGGLQSFRVVESIKELGALKEQLRVLPRSIDTSRYNMLSTWFNSFKVDILPSRDAGTRGLNITVPDKIKMALCGMSASLSISQGQLATILIAEIIKDQDSTIEGHAKDLDESVRGFLILCQARLLALKSVLEMLGSK